MHEYAIFLISINVSMTKQVFKNPLYDIKFNAKIMRRKIPQNEIKSVAATLLRPNPRLKMHFLARYCSIHSAIISSNDSYFMDII